ncbi:hypothetical protein CEXT_195081 [Caerostris extrusa]|uniref:Uncharacterized protein n=1 Tax=Caerostris extrusa TaxID=172846 RepID=A0AAV4M824_CAEEX|nr:hypothetical protein CEXT_195081 [Caerostris extrusa]
MTNSLKLVLEFGYPLSLSTLLPFTGKETQSKRTTNTEEKKRNRERERQRKRFTYFFAKRADSNPDFFPRKPLSSIVPSGDRTEGGGKGKNTVSKSQRDRACVVLVEIYFRGVLTAVAWADSAEEKGNEVFGGGGGGKVGRTEAFVNHKFATHSEEVCCGPKMKPGLPALEAHLAATLYCSPTPTPCSLSLSPS